MYSSDGQIVRIRFKNVLTYSSMEMYPCAKLNLIVGANGSGKSTIITAIILCLGGNTDVVGRAKELSKYVKVGQRNARIEIELFSKNGNDIITRYFNTENQSRFKLNGEFVSEDRIRKLMKSYNIQIDNLCQVLPQEKLEYFAKMNDHERLVATLKTIGDPRLSKCLTDLKEKSNIEKDFEKKVTQLQNQLTDVTSQKREVEEQAMRLKEKQFYIECLKLLKQRKVWMIYDHLKKTLDLVDSTLAAKKAACSTVVPVLEKTLTDVKNRLDELKYDSDAQAQFVETLKAVKTIQLRISETEEKVQEAKTNYELMVKKAAAMVNEIKKLQEKIAQTEEEIRSKSNVDSEIQKLGGVLNQEKDEIGRILSDKEKESMKLSSIRNKMKAVESQLSKLEDAMAAKRRILWSLDKEAYEGLEWLEANQDRFGGHVYGPMFLYLNVTQPRYANSVENAIGSDDLKAFVCELPSDTKILLAELKDKRRLRINVVTGVGNWNEPARRRIDNLRQYGIFGFVSDLIDTPEVIMKYLKKMKGINSIYVGDDNTFRMRGQIPDEVRTYCTDRYYSSSKKSEFTNRKIDSLKEISEGRFLQTNVDINETQSLRHELQDLNAEYDRQRRAVEQYDAVLGERDRRKRDLNVQLNSLQAQKTALVNLMTLLERLKRQLRVSRDSLIDVPMERQRCTLFVRSYLTQASNMFEELALAMDGLNEAHKRLELSNLESCRREDECDQCIRLASEFVDGLIQETGSFGELEAKRLRLETFVRGMRTMALKYTNGVDPRSPRFSKRRYFFRLDCNVNVLRRLIRTYTAKVEFVDGVKYDVEVLATYKKLCRSETELTEKINRKRRRFEEYMAELNTMQETWCTEVDQLVKKIDRNFSRFFAEIGCVGNIEWRFNNNDISLSCIQIKVKFREENDMCILNSQVQSGGERAVSVAIYLLSLQELTTVPFRCIDEINQGMDVGNERRIFNLLSHMTESNCTTQYFLLTPKLLRDLDFPRSMRVFCPLNGYSIAQNSWPPAVCCNTAESQDADE